MYAQFNLFMYCIRVGIIPCLFHRNVWFNVITIITMHMLCLCVGFFAISRAYGKLNILFILKCEKNKSNLYIMIVATCVYKYLL